MYFIFLQGWSTGDNYGIIKFNIKGGQLKYIIFYLIIGEHLNQCKTTFAFGTIQSHCIFLNFFIFIILLFLPTNFSPSYVDSSNEFTVCEAT